MTKDPKIADNWDILRELSKIIIYKIENEDDMVVHPGTSVKIENTFLFTKKTLLFDKFKLN